MSAIGDAKPATGADDDRSWFPRAIRSIGSAAREDPSTAVVVVVGVIGTAVAFFNPPTLEDAHLWLSLGLGGLTTVTVMVAQARYRMDRQITSVKTLALSVGAAVGTLEALASATSQGAFLKRENHVRQGFMSNATKLDISGVTLQRTIADDVQAIVAVLRSGGHVRIMITEWSEVLEGEFNKRFESGKARPNELRVRLDSLYGDIHRVVQDVGLAPGRGTLEVGHLPFFAPCGIVSIHGVVGIRELRCELYHDHSIGDQTAFYLAPVDETAADLIELFQATFDNWWGISRVDLLIDPELEVTELVLPPVASVTGPEDQ